MTNLLVPAQRPQAPRPAWSLRARLLLLFLVMTTLTGLTTAAIAVASIQSGAESAQAVSQAALRRQAEAFLVQLNERGAREIDLTLSQIASQVVAVAGFAAATFEHTPSDAALWSVDDHMFLGPSGQFMNGPDDPSSAFVPNTRPLTPAVVNDLQRSAYLELLVPSLLAESPTVVAIYLGTPRDVVRYFPNIELGRVVPPDFAVTSRPWYIGALQHNDPEKPVWWTEPYADATGRGLVTTAAMPVRDTTGRVLGVVGFDVTLTDLRDRVEATRFLESGYPFIIDSSGRAIALPPQGYPDLLGREQLPDEVGVDLSGSPTGFAPVLARMAAGERGFESLTVAGRELFVAFTPLEATGWSLGSVVDAADVLAPALTLRSQVGEITQSLLLNRLIPASLVITAGVVLLGLLLTGRLVQPIRRLVEAAQRLGAGEFDIKVPADSADELGILASTFNTMAEELAGAYRSLERRVEQRTRQVRTAAEVARAATSIPNLQELLRRAVELICERFGYYHAAIFLLDESGKIAILREATGEAGAALVARGHHLPVGSPSIIGWVTANGQPRVAYDVSHDPSHLRSELLPGTRSEAAVPLQVGGRILGALDVQSLEPNAFGPEDLYILQMLADQLSAAIQNARLAERSALAAERARLISEMTTAMAGATDIERIVRTAGHFAHRALNQPEVVVRLVTSEDRAQAGESVTGSEEPT